MWMLEKHLACPHCGTRLEEWDPKEGGRRHAYIPQVYTCPGCSITGDALEAATKQSKATGGEHGLRVRLLPDYVVKHQVKMRSPEERRRMMERERQRLEEEKLTDDQPRVEPRKAASLGGGSRPPPIEKKPLSERPEPVE